MKELLEKIDLIFENKPEKLTKEDKKNIDDAVELLDKGVLRACSKVDNTWQVNTSVKKAILLYIKYNNNFLISNAPEGTFWFDKVKLKMSGKTAEDYSNINYRMVPGAFIRYGSYLAKNTIIMPSFVNIGSYVDEGTMVDSFVTVGSCAQIGKNCHISEGVGVGGVLEPLQATPVIIEDNCFLGAGSKVLEGVIVRKGAKIGAGTLITASTKIIDRETGSITYGEVPENSVVIPGSTLSKNNISLSCAVIIKKVDEKTASKTSINELLRDL